MRVIFHGRLAELCPEVYEIEAASPYEALNALVRQLPALRSTTNPVSCAIVDHEHVELIVGKTDVDEIHVVPTFEGAKKGGFFQIAIGALLIAASFFTGPAVGAFLFNAGLSMVLGGVIQLLAPAPSTTNASGTSNPENSKILGPPRNTVRLGTRIPVAYGTNKLFGHILSFDVNVTHYDMKYDQNSGAAPPSGGGSSGVEMTASHYWGSTVGGELGEVLHFVDVNIRYDNPQAKFLQVVQMTNGVAHRIFSLGGWIPDPPDTVAVDSTGPYPGTTVVFRYLNPEAAGSITIQYLDAQNQPLGSQQTLNLGRWVDNARDK